MQGLIDFINSWCVRIKYPYRDLDFAEGTRNPNFKDVEPLLSSLSIRQFLYRLNYNELRLMECKYRNPGYSHHNIYIKRKKAGRDHEIMMNIYLLNNKDSSFFVVKADEVSGKVIPSEELSKYVNFDNDVYLDDLLMTFNDFYSDELDFSELVHTIYNHNCDIELRKNILELSILKIFYTSESYKRGYTRAKKFLDEVNTELNAGISLEEFNQAVLKHFDSSLVEEEKKDISICSRRIIGARRK